MKEIHVRRTFLISVRPIGEFVNRPNQLYSPFPVLREHALFTLHNLLKNNPENQAIVDAIRPAAEFDDAGVLKNKFGALKIK